MYENNAFGRYYLGRPLLSPLFISMILAVLEDAGTRLWPRLLLQYPNEKDIRKSIGSFCRVRIYFIYGFNDVCLIELNIYYLRVWIDFVIIDVLGVSEWGTEDGTTLLSQYVSILMGSTNSPSLMISGLTPIFNSVYFWRLGTSVRYFSGKIL